MPWRPERVSEVLHVPVAAELSAATAAKGMFCGRRERGFGSITRADVQKARSAAAFAVPVRRPAQA